MQSLYQKMGQKSVKSSVCGLISRHYVFTNQIVSAFLTDQTAFSYAVQFARILLSTSFLFGVFYVLVNALQAMGAATPALLISMSRQGIIFIPALFILQTAIGMTGLVWAQPVADVLSILIAAILFEKTIKKMQMLYYHMLRIYLFQF